MYMVFKGAKQLFKKIVCQPEREREDDGKGEGIQR
jgi:hypothetical protein